jgi:hypothetical protein
VGDTYQPATPGRQRCSASPPVLAGSPAHQKTRAGRTDSARAPSLSPLPAQTGFDGYWVNVPEGSTPHPQPIDVMLGCSKLAIRAHESIPGIWVSQVGEGGRAAVLPGARALGLDFGVARARAR